MNAKIEKQFFEDFLKFFHQAEERRRWNIERDIPWEQANRTTSESTAKIVESFSAVEMYLPDYTSKMLHMIRRSRGRAWFQANWGYEESKHSLTLDRWLIASGNRTPEQMEAFADQLLGEEWELPFDHPRQRLLGRDAEDGAPQHGPRDVQRRHRPGVREVHADEERRAVEAEEEGDEEREAGMDPENREEREPQPERQAVHGARAGGDSRGPGLRVRPLPDAGALSDPGL